MVQRIADDVFERPAHQLRIAAQCRRILVCRDIGDDADIRSLGLESRIGDHLAQQFAEVEIVVEIRRAAFDPRQGQELAHQFVQPP